MTRLASRKFLTIGEGIIRGATTRETRTYLGVNNDIIYACVFRSEILTGVAVRIRNSFVHAVQVPSCEGASHINCNVNAE